MAKKYKIRGIIELSAEVEAENSIEAKLIFRHEILQQGRPYEECPKYKELAIFQDAEDWEDQS